MHGFVAESGRRLPALGIQVLASVHRLAVGELKGVFDKAINLAKLEAQIANPDISGEVTMAMSNATTQLTFVSSQLEESTRANASKLLLTTGKIG